ncbi:MAG: hypothetical protein MN733_16495 [Nitrososphaera sp.]|nr:hypothetical protein [Nitrososphaera sp.]
MPQFSATVTQVEDVAGKKGNFRKIHFENGKKINCFMNRLKFNVGQIHEIVTEFSKSGFENIINSRAPGGDGEPKTSDVPSGSGPVYTASSGRIEALRAVSRLMESGRIDANITDDSNRQLVQWYLDCWENYLNTGALEPHA